VKGTEIARGREMKIYHVNEMDWKGIRNNGWKEIKMLKKIE
jgi:hypothetical protein